MRRTTAIVVSSTVAFTLVVTIIIGARIPPRLDPASTRPDGARGMVLLLDEFAGSVEVSDIPPSPDHEVAVLLVDELHTISARSIDAWVLAGGTLVVADPGSPFAPDTTQPSSPSLGTACRIAAVSDVSELSGIGGLAFATEGVDAWCLGDEAAAIVVVTRHGAGLIVSIASNEILENRHIAEADNAVLAVALGAPYLEANVVVLERRLRIDEDDLTAEDRQPPSLGEDERRDVGEGQQNILDLLPEYLRWVLLNLAIAWLVYALARGRRLGKPIPETQPIDIAGSELVRATGRLYRGGADGTVERHLIDGVRAGIGRELGLGPSVDDETLARVIADRTDLDEHWVRSTLAPSRAGDDAQLVALTHRLDAILQEVRSERHKPTD